MTAALVPAKSLHTGKSRLRAALGAETSRALALAMLLDVVEVLRSVPRLEPVAVVTPDPEIALGAEGLGARALLDRDPGLNASLVRGAAALGAAAQRGLLVVLGDVAGIRAADVEQLLDAADELGAPGVVLAPSSDGGSAALARRPGDAIAPRFGPGSAAAHRAAARERGLPFRELELPSLAIDVDGSTDLQALQRKLGLGPRAQRVVRERLRPGQRAEAR